MRGGLSYEMSSTCVQGGLPRSLGGYQANMIMEPHSPASAWQYHSVVPKQEPMDEERNDSGVNSGSDFHSSSPGSEGSQDINMSYSSPTTQVSQQSHPAPYYSTPVMHQRLSNHQSGLGYHHNLPMHMMYNHNPLSPPNSEPMASPKSHQTMTPTTPKIKNENFAKDAETTLTPCASPNTENQQSFSTPTTESSGEVNEDPLRRLQQALEKNGLLPSSISPKPSECSGDDDGKSDNEMEEYDEQGLRIPKVNSHGKVKKFKCKQCEFIAITKLDFWEHTKGHIKADKLLTCPKCPFVTEYKHHLEYHLRNHFGSKPFKCDKCSYSCVNKSMLNSHLKSHSNVYQYRCSDCSYATKYCHSLKLHLRKYQHKPAMVLNPDGTPNPLPIIDVYGTRRGPKVKSQNSKDEENSPKPEQMLPFPLNQLIMNSPPQVQFPFGYPFLGGFPGPIPNPLLFQNLEKLARERQLSHESEPEQEEQVPQENESGVLDLSKPENYGDNNPIKNRRKGRAFKYSPVPGHSSDEDDESTTIFSNVEVVQNTKEDSSSDKEENAEEIVNNNNKVEDFSCQYCNIAFGDAVLYTMHMGYHGYKNPFTCNMCGEECKDKVSFFLHIARTPHS